MSEDSATPGPVVLRFDALPSTQTHARALLEEPIRPALPFVVTAAEQTAGLGQRRAPWDSPIGGLWCTLVTEVDHPDCLDGLGLRIGLACTELVRQLCASMSCPHPVRLKWPNDVLVGGRKVAGILTETMPSDAGATVLVGVGINANLKTDHLHEPLRDTATTLMEACGASVALESLLDGLIDLLLPAIGARRISPELRERANTLLYGRGEPVDLVIDGRRQRGLLTGIDEHGRPIVEPERNESCTTN